MGKVIKFPVRTIQQLAPDENFWRGCAIAVCLGVIFWATVIALLIHFL